MDCVAWFRRTVLSTAVAAVAVAPSQPVTAQIAAPASSAVAPSAATAPPATPAAPRCVIPPEYARFDLPLYRTGRQLAAGHPIKIVAIGSSSTFGAGASKPYNSYPSRLAVELAREFAGRDITVLNRGVNGDTATDMLARFEHGVIAEKPDLVLWQVGTNSLLRGDPVAPHRSLLHGGIARLKTIGADIVLIDPQYAPRVIARPAAESMVSLIEQTAKTENVNLFRRFALMRHWRKVEHMPFEAFLSSDELHMNDFSYGCVAHALSRAVAEAMKRPVATAAAPKPKR
jgi:acyl-CoA thioesterase-1